MGSELMTNAIDTITRPAISAFNSLVGSAGTEAAQQATEAGLSGLMNQAIGALTKQVAQWTLDTFGPAATNLIFESAASGGGAAVTSSGHGYICSIVVNYCFGNIRGWICLHGVPDC